MAAERPVVAAIGRRYVLHESLGKGGMGVVYRATDRLTGREIALKRVNAESAEILFENSASAVDFRLALAREFKLSASLRHPNIIKVLDYGFDAEQQPYFTMELLKQPQTILEASAGLPLPAKAALLVQMCYALAYLHRRGIIHRDLKPGNVLVEAGTVKVLDFGLSAFHERSATAPDDLIDTTAGTLAYMAPETLMGEESGIPADLYALGMMGYEIIAGQHPFHIDDAGTLINDIMFTLPDFNVLAPSVAIAGVFEKLLRKDPHERYQSAAQVADDLRAALDMPEPAASAAIRESFLQAAALVGRDDELRQLTAALDTAIKGQGSSWLIAGENGVGKTRLIDELRRLAMVRGAIVMRGQAVRVGSRPYEMWLPIFRWLPLLQDDLPNDALSLLKLFMDDLTMLLQRSVPHLSAPQLDPATLRARLRELVETTLRAAGGTLVILLEDLHWAGSESRLLLHEVTQFVADLPLLLIASYRSDEALDLAEQAPQMQRMKLRRLSETAIEDLSAAMLGEGGRSPQVVDLLRRETEGNVFFMVEVVRALAEEVGNLEQIGRMTLPQRVFAGGIKTVIARRLEQVDAASRDLLRIAAVMGRELNTALLSAVAPKADIGLWLTRCASAAILEGEGDAWGFAHDKLRESLLDEMTASERQGLHGRVAERLEAHYGDQVTAHVTALAYHWGQAGNTPREAYYLLLAGEQALRNGAYHEAIDFFHRGENLLPRLGLAHDALQRRRADIQQRLASAHVGIGGYTTARALYQSSLALYQTLEDHAGMAANYGYLGDIALALDEFDNAQHAYTQSLTLYRAAQDEAGAARALNSLGNVAYERGDDETARRLYQESLSLARQLGREWGMAGSVRQQTPAPETSQDAYTPIKARFEQQLEERRAARDQAGVAEAYYRLGETAQATGAYADAAGYYEQSALLRHLLEDAAGLAQTYERLGALAYVQADFAGATRQYRRALQSMVGQPATLITLQTLLGMAQVMHALGQDEAALELVAFLVHYPDSPDVIQDMGEALLFELEEGLAPEVVEAAYDSGKHTLLGTFVTRLLA